MILGCSKNRFYKLASISPKYPGHKKSVHVYYLITHHISQIKNTKYVDLHLELCKPKISQFLSISMLSLSKFQLKDIIYDTVCREIDCQLGSETCTLNSSGRRCDLMSHCCVHWSVLWNIDFFNVSNHSTRIIPQDNLNVTSAADIEQINIASNEQWSVQNSPEQTWIMQTKYKRITQT